MKPWDLFKIFNTFLKKCPLAFFLGLFFLNYGCSLPKITVMNDPLSKVEHFALGLTYEKKGQFDLALREYKLAEPYPLATLGIGNISFIQGEFKAAEKSYRKVLARTKDPDAANNLAFLLVMEHRDLQEAYELALLAVEEALKLDLTDEILKNYRSTLNLAETALMNSQKNLERTAQ
ncbi:MAG: hypothetical protein LBF22_03250 [Deltaproteobacteria bacterium]|nr:hypothetical protein [Deltaproteobacteria bacterium]